MVFPIFWKIVKPRFVTGFAVIRYLEILVTFLLLSEINHCFNEATFQEQLHKTFPRIFQTSDFKKLIKAVLEFSNFEWMVAGYSNEFLKVFAVKWAFGCYGSRNVWFEEKGQWIAGYHFLGKNIHGMAEVAVSTHTSFDLQKQSKLSFSLLFRFRRNEKNQARFWGILSKQ